MVVLYSTGCPRCLTLKRKLKANNIEYSEISDREQILSAGIDKVPVIEENGVRYEDDSISEWIDKHTGKIDIKNEKQ